MARAHLFMKREKWWLGLKGPEARDLGPGIGGVMTDLWEEAGSPRRDVPVSLFFPAPSEIRTY